MQERAEKIFVRDKNKGRKVRGGEGGGWDEGCDKEDGGKTARSKGERGGKMRRD